VSYLSPRSIYQESSTGVLIETAGGADAKSFYDRGFIFVYINHLNPRTPIRGEKAAVFWRRGLVYGGKKEQAKNRAKGQVYKVF